jgi:hypothetical protein
MQLYGTPAQTGPSGNGAVKISRARVLPGRPGRNAKPLTLRVWLKRPARLVLLVQGPAPSCESAGRLRYRATRGTNRFAFTGRVRGQALAPGVYRIVVVAVRPSGRKVIGTTQVAVGANAPNAASARFSCTSAPTLNALPFLAALVAPPFTGSGGQAVASGAQQAGTKAAVATRKAGKSVISHLPKLPRPPLPTISEPGLSNVKGLAAILLVILALATMGALIVQYFRGSWNP